MRGKILQKVDSYFYITGNWSGLKLNDEVLKMGNNTIFCDYKVYEEILKEC